MIKQVYVPYWEWECFRYGLYSKIDNENEYLEKCLFFMNDTKRFSLAMEYVVNNWKKTMLNSLSNNSINRIAFIGQCASLHGVNCPSYITKKAWKLLDKNKRILANIEAEKHLKLWTLMQLQTILDNGNNGATEKVYQMKFLLS